MWKEIILEHIGFNCGGGEVVTITQSSVASRRFKVVWQGDSNFMVQGLVEDRQSCVTDSVYNIQATLDSHE